MGPSSGRVTAVARACVLLLVTAAVVALAGGVAIALVGLSGIDGGTVAGTVASAGEVPGDTACTDPPCGPESVPSPSEVVVSLPLIVPVLLVGLAALLGAAIVAAGVLRRSGRWVGSGLALVVTALAVLVVSELLPHLANPCRLGSVPSVCERSPEYGVDFTGDAHLLGHAVLGWVPAVLFLVWVLRRTMPQLVPGGRARRDYNRAT